MPGANSYTSTVTIGTALPAGTNAIGKLAANSGVTIGAVELAASQTLATVTTVGSISGTVTVAGTGTFAVQATVAAAATNIAKAEDVASANADVGVPSMAVRKATPANTSDADGDYEFLQISAGRLWTSAIIDTALPAGTNAIGKLASNTGVTIGAVEIAASQTLATVTTVSTVTNLSQLGGTAIAMNTGVRAAGVQRVTICTDDTVTTTLGSETVSVNAVKVGGTAITVNNGAPTNGTQRVTLADISVGDYEAVAAGQTTVSLGATGGTGDYLGGILVIPATTSPGNVLLRDGSGSDMTVFTGGASSVSNLVPFFIPLGIVSGSGAWKVTTGSNVSVIGVGNFT